MQLDPNDKLESLRKGVIYRAIGRFEDAREQLEIAVLQLPSDAYAQFALGLLMEFDFGVDPVYAGKELYAQAVKIDPGVADFQAALAAYIHRSKSECQTAKAIFRKAIDLPNPSAYVFGEYGSFLLRHQDSSAEVYLEKALALDPDQPSYLVSMGYAVIGHTKTPNAKTIERGYGYVERGYAMDPSNPDNEAAWNEFAGLLGLTMPRAKERLEKTKAALKKKQLLNKGTLDRSCCKYCLLKSIRPF